MAGSRQNERILLLMLLWNTGGNQPEYHGPAWCLSPADTGLCKASEKRFYYNSVLGKCRQFKYTGCGGNNNNFTTKKECVRACKKGFIKRVTKGGSVNTQKGKEPTVKIVYTAMD